MWYRLPYGPLQDDVDHVWVRMRDGIELATDVYLPVMRDHRRVPAVLFRIPYDKTGDDSFIPPIARLMNEHGYAVVGQDIRGKVRSGGELEPLVHEVSDGSDTLDWIVAQRWSNGAVAVMGDSYNGYTAWAAAVSGHPAVRAVVPRVISTYVADDWLFRQGIFRLSLIAGWAAFATVGPDLIECDLDWGTRPLRELLPSSLDGQRSRILDKWMAEPRSSAHWRHNPLGSHRHRNVRAPVMHWGGWWDPFCRGQIRDFEAMRRTRGAGAQFLMMGATDHEFHEHSLETRRPVDHMADLDRRRSLLPTMLEPALRFLATAFDGRRPSVEPAVRWCLTNAGWCHSARWPPPTARREVLYLVDGSRAHLGPEGGGLSPRLERLSPSARWTHDPNNLVPSLEEPPYKALARAFDERDVEVRDDVLTFTADERRSPLDLAGPVRALLSIQAQAPSTQIVAKLVDVCPDGRAYRIAEGAALVMNPSDGATTRVDLGPTGYRVLPGHRLRLEIASSSFPRYIWHPGTAEDPWLALKSTSVEHRLGLRSHDCRLELFVLSGEAEYL